MSEINENEEMSSDAKVLFFVFGLIFSILGLIFLIIGISIFEATVIVGGVFFLVMGIPFIVIWIKDKFKIKKKENGESNHLLKKIGVAVVVVILLCGIINCAVSPSGIGGDGKTSCKLCGKSSVFSHGFCKDCFNDFIDN